MPGTFPTPPPPVPHAGPYAWKEFKDIIEDYSTLSLERRRQYVFRGQPNSNWRLQPSIDRLGPYADETARQDSLEQHLREFWRECAGLHAHSVSNPLSVQAEMIARHHGVPTSVLDWSTSPYVAAFFAFDDETSIKAAAVSVWCMNRAHFLVCIPDVEIVEDDDLGSRNTRAIEQRGLFTRLLGNHGYVDAAPGMAAGLVRFDIKAAVRRLALDDLDEMRINARSLFRDMDGAARSGTRRVGLKAGGIR